jgi:gliding motility-associated-like protein
LVSGTGTVVDPSNPNTLIDGLDVGVSVFAWTIDNGPCGTTTDQVSITIFNAASPNANAGPDQQICTPASSTSLAGSTPIFPATASWTIISGSGALSDATLPNASLTGLTVGATVLVWTVSNGPCPNGLTSDTVVVQVFENGAGSADAGDDQSLCKPGPALATMAASVPVSPAVGVWQLVSGTGTITNANDPATTIEGIGFGDNVFSWTISSGTCGTTTDDLVISIFDANEPAADAGPDQVLCEDTVETHMAATALITTTASAEWSFLSGAGIIDSSAVATTLIEQLQAGDNIFLWTVSNGACGTTADSCIITLEDCTTLVIPDAFSPNGDGTNDEYVIEGLYRFPQNTFKVFNRWGNLVLDRSPYNNDWDGRSEGDMNWGEELPESTYYYILDLGNGDEPFSGYIYLKR